ncbi:MAG: WG repeat-containing protein [Prevotellaceae bacterium]|jgi:hypothetical protein|nr:WG repeat-containing protein [Prevotellaceae bacterium]
MKYSDFKKVFVGLAVLSIMSATPTQQAYGQAAKANSTQELTPKRNENSGKEGYVNKAGKLVIPYKFDKVEPFSDGFATVCIGSKWGVIDKKGTEIISCLYQKIKHMKAPSGLAGFSVTLDGKMSFFDITGRQTVPFEYSGFAILEEDGGLVGMYQGKWVRINKDGQREDNN